MIERDYIINRLSSRTTTRASFDFDMIQGPFIRNLFTETDIGDLYEISTSVRYSAKPKKKFSEIDRIMSMRGFRRFISGTNRACYEFLEDKSFVAKVPFSTQALKDNLREYQNQHLVKPFVTKVFDVASGGILGLFERILPITKRQEFEMIADDIYYLISHWFNSGEYITDDCGSKYFMNWGIRKGFGPVLHDYPYIWKLDHKKIFCEAPNPLSPTGRCEGIIDHDPGYNFFYCTKCGARYTGKDLAKAEAENKIVLGYENKEDIKMKIRTMGGTKSANSVTAVGQSLGAKNTPANKPIRVSSNKVQKSEAKQEKKVTPENLQVSGGRPQESKGNKNTQKQNNKVQKTEAKQEKPKAESPIEIDESLKGAKQERPVIDTRSTFEKFIDAIVSAQDMMNQVFNEIAENEEDKAKFITIVKDFYNMFKDVISDDYNIVDGSITDLAHDCNEYSEDLNDLINDEEQLFGRLAEVPMQLRIAMLKFMLESDFVLDIIKSSTEGKIAPIIRYNMVTDDGAVIPVCAGDERSLNSYADGEDKVVEASEEATVQESIKIDTDENGEVAEDDEYEYYNGFALFKGEIINTKDIFPGEASQKVLVMCDEKGDYVTMEDGVIMAINNIGNRSLGKLAIVSKKWLDDVTSESAEAGEDDKSEESVGTSLKDKIPTGIRMEG